MSDLLDLSRRATDAVLALGIMVLDIPSGIAIAAWAPGRPWHGQPEGRTGEDIDAWALLDDVVAGKAVLDLRDPLTRAGALPLLVRQAWGSPTMRASYESATYPHRWVVLRRGLLGWKAKAHGSTETGAWVAALEAVAAERAEEKKIQTRPGGPSPTPGPGGHRER